jgi:hypothetical protein
MTQSERNIEIAKMLGYKYVTWQEAKEEKYGKHIKAGWWSAIPKRVHPMIPIKEHYIGRSNNDLKFHSDWNYLMNAVEFIENKKYEIDIFGNCVEICTTPDEDYVSEVVGKTKKEAVFIAVSDFARSYNKNKL